jgi:heterodisulfide reductase subunit A
MAKMQDASLAEGIAGMACRIVLERVDTISRRRQALRTKWTDLETAAVKKGICMPDKKTLVIGGGVAGISAALALAHQGVATTLVEQSPFIGGHAAGYTCKAADECVKCGACIVPRKVQQANRNGLIDILTGSQVSAATADERHLISLVRAPVRVDPDKCTACGTCIQVCPEPGAVRAGPSAENVPPVGIVADTCRHLQQQECTLCQDACPAAAIDLDAPQTELQLAVDAVVLATGFAAFDPTNKPYGYAHLPDVVTGLEVEAQLRDGRELLRPSDQMPARRIGFIQCVGSRDATLGHLWCSKICCGSALRMANLIRHRCPEAEVTIYYIDIQTIGKGFPQYYDHSKNGLRFVRSIPVDIVPSGDGRLKTTVFNPDTRQVQDDPFDMVVLSVGISPSQDAPALATVLGVPISDAGFYGEPAPDSGLFCCGTAKGPMGIAESVADAEKVAWQVMDHLASPSHRCGRDCHPASHDKPNRRTIE